MLEEFNSMRYDDIEEDVKHWLSLMQSESYEELEQELKETQLRLMPTLEPEDICTMSLDEAWDLAEGYTHE